MDSSAQERPCVVVPSLKELCQRALVANIDRLRHLGVTPQFLVADALAQCTPEQLDTLEHHNPHIVRDNERLWMSHCLRKYRDLQARIEDGAMEPVSSWRVLYWDMRRQDEARAQEILHKVRVKSAAIERNVRKIQLTRVPAREVIGRGGGRPGRPAKEVSLVQRVRMDTIAHMRMMGGGSWWRSQSNPARSSLGGSGTHSRQISPAVSPAQSPPHLQSYSPPYLSSASSCSPPHSSYSPPYVPEISTSGGDLSPVFDVFGDMFGVPSGRTLAKKLPETVVIKEQTMMRRRPSSALAKRKRSDSETCVPGERRGQRPLVGSREDASAAAQDKRCEESTRQTEIRIEDTARRRSDGVETVDE
ncbi:Elongin-A [Coemansia spiralis]|uniref:Elongin-A n=1 Tax=Coemansia spiralis TaxID=417178 RepID=A0A9W8GJG2_9FUNG|nr:Elongin-A [Coemansia spiralis]